MGYVAIKGGGQAIAGAEKLLEFIRTRQGESAEPLDLDTIENQLYFLHSRILSEGGLFHPKLASLAIKQSLGDTLEAAFALRAYRSTKPRLIETPVLDTTNMRVIRRISASFKDIPGGQMLGASTDYALRLMRTELLNESREDFQAVAAKWLDENHYDDIPDTFPKVLDALREEGLLPPVDESMAKNKPFDITREPLIFPVPRSAALSTMARAETGSILAIAYSNMRGYGDVHPTVAELRVGYLPVMLPHPITGELIEVGEVLMTECEVVAMYEDDDEGSQPTFSLGYGACFGHNEVKAISMSILDRSLQLGMQNGPTNPSEDPEFVLLHIDGIDSMGFCTHYKMPHYVTFQSDMDRLRTTQEKHGAQHDQTTQGAENV
ncbi:MAG: carbon-phosphorus lyase [Piscirickettsiaceae bacterium CG_4_9_14_3_um_filter_43_564]|uniref:Alpha-D-ribose 1-methylphosphonate 5-triphosphate synthase subunit PhnI n=2 Tax=Hydrogenovibrio crunogenus TaxID=39765 RepID=A0A4P7P2B2_9GAMM|nr:carbon-phosphorus lyase complex subunit PhnI [Hydrogenovibrio crunogenus]NCN44245.1 carbon-phosphorus lyase complex subunit PhnI [Thiomicrospira sp.]PJA66155.1 MAG: carbon-phosphorus lyase [Piscirickettsiaceae bacterium CG_4_9_14_3_um_filter_43_564]NCN67355.1 carbon-phosphorus lyase complex subunit PhnI [Thiomicrospira sp.]NCO13595.1 carbon-phosphorus lyase complex subunit PhnI [Thiomicrospira sp.]QBZ84166.1 Alpha-D-ribose 1-methylphosphonate 5-triphosphate synthase subunit PhnI [Hydrogenov